MFQGFSQDSLDFLWQLRFNNDRSWFEPRKELYKAQIEAPMKELCRELYEGVTQQAEDMELMSKVSRIYRDARRLFGRGPYKDHLWLSITKPGDSWTTRPTFWFEIEPEGYSFGLGYWAAQAVTMAKLRARIDRDPKQLDALVRKLEKDGTFTLRGEEFKRRRPAPTPRLEPWYNKKQGFSLYCDDAPAQLLYSPELPQYVLERWEKLLPLYRYLVTLEADPDPRQV